MKKRDSNILQHGEHTGHFHAAEGAGVAVYEEGQDVWFEAPQGAKITHQEHHTIELPAGEYERTIVREYDHFAEEARDIRD